MDIQLLILYSIAAFFIWGIGGIIGCYWFFIGYSKGIKIEKYTDVERLKGTWKRGLKFTLIIQLVCFFCVGFLFLQEDSLVKKGILSGLVGFFLSCIGILIYWAFTTYLVDLPDRVKYIPPNKLKEV
jgi:hypothetical protein